jgi:hypothetical protein
MSWRQLATRRSSTRHTHPPVRRDKLAAAAGTSLVIEFGEYDPALHELPTVVHRHLHLLVLPITRRRIGRSRRALRSRRVRIQTSSGHTERQCELAPADHH